MLNGNSVFELTADVLPKLSRSRWPLLPIFSVLVTCFTSLTKLKNRLDATELNTEPMNIFYVYPYFQYKFMVLRDRKLLIQKPCLRQ
jgi:hypothetical protein